MHSVRCLLKNIVGKNTHAFAAPLLDQEELSGCHNIGAPIFQPITGTILKSPAWTSPSPITSVGRGHKKIKAKKMIGFCA